jgi:hypothetical protein
MKITDKLTLPDSWLWDFKECHGIRKLNISGEVLPAGNETAVLYSELFHYLVEEHKFLPTQICNANETGLSKWNTPLISCTTQV